MARAYSAFLGKMPWDIALVRDGAREGLTKFLSNAYLRSFPGRRKYELTQLISPEARDRIIKARVNAGVVAGLVFEHVVPKHELIQKPCEDLAERGELTPEYVLSKLRQYWLLAMVTKEEDQELRERMPAGCYDEDLLARYTKKHIELITNPFMVPGVPNEVLKGVARWAINGATNSSTHPSP